MTKSLSLMTMMILLFSVSSLFLFLFPFSPVRYYLESGRLSGYTSISFLCYRVGFNLAEQKIDLM
ncbi:hypothetical protein BJX62DRAFT_63712 [Aspergillus germanicus]